jgi:hypothetical protein
MHDVAIFFYIGAEVPKKMTYGETFSKLQL